MSKYRISVSIDGENFFWVVIDKERFIRNSTTDDRTGTKLISYNKTNICDLCRKNNNITDKSILYPRKAYREYNSQLPRPEWRGLPAIARVTVANNS